MTSKNMLEGITCDCRAKFSINFSKVHFYTEHKLICKFDISFRGMFYANNIHLFVSRERSTVEKTIVTDTPATLALRPNYKVTISYPFVLINCHGRPWQTAECEHAHARQFLFIKWLRRMIRNYKSFVYCICLEIIHSEDWKSECK